MFTLAFLMVMSGLAGHQPSESAQKAQDKLQGNWIAIGIEEKGDKCSPEEVKKEDLSITIQGSELTLRHGKATPARFSFTLDPGKKPAHIDFKDLGDRARPGVQHAIYSLEKGELKICFGSTLTPNDPEDRPQEFATAKGSENRPPKGKVMFTFKQKKK